MQFMCSQCRLILNESERRMHISAKHLRYFPFECAACKEASRKHLAATKEDMDLHISTHHNGNNLGILLLEDQAKEVELNKMIEQCHRFPIPQTPSSDSKNELYRPSDLLDTGYASTGNTTQNLNDEDGSDDDITIIEDNREIATVFNITSDGNSPELAAQTESTLPSLTSSQVISSIPVDSSHKRTITKLFIVISEGVVCFETTGRRTYNYAPLRDYLPILYNSVLSKECEIAIQFYASGQAIPYHYRKRNLPVKEFTSLLPESNKRI